MKRYTWLICIILFIFVLPLSAQNVTNVEVEQLGKKLVVTYSLDKTAVVTLSYSTDGGKTFSAPLKQVSGDVGRGIASGRHTMTWNVLSEVSQLVCANLVMKVTASREEMSTKNGHEWVDLGLPSGILWATYNVGATTPEGYGNYYAWGETTTKSTYNWSTYKYCKGTSNTLTKYCTNSSYGTVDNKTNLESADDAAHVNWGGSWRMPTHEEQVELYDNCTWTWTTLNRVKGYRVTSKKNGKSIFLPAAGYRGGFSLSSAGSDGNYWSASLYTIGVSHAWYLFFDSSYISANGIGSRHFGFTVRPVCTR